MTDNLVSQIESLALSGQDLLMIAKCLNMKRASWILYDDLKKFNSPEEIFQDKIEALYVLLQIKNDNPLKASVGHWVCWIYHREAEEYYWYDPYGIDIGRELEITKEPKTILNLTKGIKLTTNKVRHQEFREDINTCGRHCVVRSVFYHLNNSEYDRLLVRPMVPIPIKKPDDLVALLTGLVSETDEHLIKFYNKKERSSTKNQTKFMG